MATQGIVSITRGGQVVAKIVAGSDGMKARELADSIRNKPTDNPVELLHLAIAAGFGGGHVVVQTMVNDSIMLAMKSDNDWADDIEPDRLYHDREKFLNPAFNPRWEAGTAEYTEIVVLE